MAGNFSNSINHFRAIAILIIVAGHAYDLGGIVFDSFLEKTVETLLAGGTTLFVFISGFLFHHVFYERFNYKNFICAKSKNILVPYTIIGIIPIVLAVYLETGVGKFSGFFDPSGNGFFYEYLIPAGKYYWTGRFENAYWYIPFIMVTFALSPIHIFFIRLPSKYKTLIIFLFLIISILMHRPRQNLYVFQSVLYFFPVYLIGISSSIHKNIIYSRLAGKEFYILSGILFLAATEVLLGHSGNYHKPPFINGGVDIIIIQKLLLCFFLMVWLHRFENSYSKYINYLASTSFAVFFFHPILITLTKAFLKRMDIPVNESWVVYIFSTLLLTASCIGIAVLSRKIIPKYSRYLTGY